MLEGKRGSWGHQKGYARKPLAKGCRPLHSRLISDVGQGFLLLAIKLGEQCAL